MLRILGAFAWMRWRIFVNSLERTGARDAVQRVSLAIERLAPIIVAVLMIPSAIALAGLAGFAGFQLASRGDGSVPFQMVRFFLLAGSALCILGPIMLPSADRTNPVRLLLLPIPARTLYVAQAGSAVTDPWIVLLLPLVLFLPVGLLIGGAGRAAVIALIAGLVVAVIFVGISALTTTLIHLVLRDRRRGELVALALILVLPLIGFLPSIIGTSAERRARRSERSAASEQERSVPRPSRLPSWVTTAAQRTFALAPSELYATSVSAAARGNTPGAATTLAALVVTGTALHGLGLLLFRRVLSSPGTTSSRRVASIGGVSHRKLPGVSSGTSAIALTLLRLALRTPRGRSILVAPLLMMVFFGSFVLRSGAFDTGAFETRSGLGLATMGAFLALLASLPISMNQFAVDRAGLTMTLLAPLRTQQILAGKAIGVALIVLPTGLLCMALSALLLPDDRPALWLTLVLALVATCMLAAPAAAILSAMFPRVVDMNSIGRGSNAHGVAGFLGFAAFAVAGLPALALTLVATRLLDRPSIAPVLLLMWCGVAFGLARLLFIPAQKIFDHRRESLALLI